MEKRLHIVLGLGWIAGCLPVHNISQPSNFKLRFHSLIFVYSLAVGLVNSIQFCDYFISNYECIKHNNSLSKTLIVHSYNFMHMATDIIMRLIAIPHCTQIIELLKQYDSLMNNFKDDLNTSPTRRSNTIFKTFALTIGFYTLRRILYLVDFATDPNKFRESALFSYTLVCIGRVALDISTYLSICFFMSFITIFGMRLLGLFQQFAAQFQNQCLKMSHSKKHQENQLLVRGGGMHGHGSNQFLKEIGGSIRRNNTNMISTITNTRMTADDVENLDLTGKGGSPKAVMQIMNDRFIGIQSAFSTYDDIVGKLLLVLIPRYSLFIIYSLFNLTGSSTTSGIMNTMNLAQSSFTILVLCQLGHTMRNEFELCKTTLRTAYIEHGVQSHDNYREFRKDEVEVLVSAIINWKFKLTANGFFRVDYYLIPSVR